MKPVNIVTPRIRNHHIMLNCTLKKVKYLTNFHLIINIAISHSHLLSIHIHTHAFVVRLLDAIFISSLGILIRHWTVATD